MPFRIFSANTNNNVQTNVQNKCISFKAIADADLTAMAIGKIGLGFNKPTPVSNVSVGWYIEGQGLARKVKITGSVTDSNDGNSVLVVITSNTTAYPGLTYNSEYTFYSPECIE